MMYHQTNRRTHVPYSDKHPKVSPEFLRALKSIPQLPPKAQTMYKENCKPMAVPSTKNANLPRKVPTSKNQTVQPVIKQKPMQPPPVQMVSGSHIVEDDISKIAQSYVLEGNRLRKCEFIDTVRQEKSK